MVSTLTRAKKLRGSTLYSPNPKLRPPTSVVTPKQQPVLDTQKISQHALQVGYNAIKQPLYSEHRNKALEVGTLVLKDAPAAFDAVIADLLRQGNYFFDYANYLYAVRNVDSWRKQIKAYYQQIEQADWAAQDALEKWEAQVERAEADHAWAEEQASSDYSERYERWSASTSDNPGPPPRRREVRPPQLPPKPSRRPDSHYPVDTLEDTFVKAFSRSVHTPDRDGYFNYLKCCAPEYVSAVLEQPLPAFIAEDDRAMHTYFCADTGSGKSEFLKVIIHATIKKNDSALVILDANGDFARQIAHWQEMAKNQRLVYIDYNLKEGYVPIINPFQIEGLRADDYSEQALKEKRVVIDELCATFELIIANTGAVFHSENMQMVLRECITVLVNRPNSTIKDLQAFMDDNKNAKLVAFAKTLTQDVYESSREFFEYKYVGAYKTTKEAIEGRLRRLRGGALERMTCGKNTLHLDDFIRQKKIIVCNISKNSMSGYDGPAFGRLMVALLQSTAKRNAVKIHNEDDRYPCHLILDECHNFVCSTMKEILLESRKYRLMLTLCQQIIGYGMPTDLAKIVTSQPHLKIGGKATNATKEKFADFVGVARDEYTLRKGEFIISAGENPRLRIKSRTDLLGNSNAMYPSVWNLTAMNQIKRYYRKVMPMLTTPPSTDSAADAQRDSLETAQPATTRSSRPKRRKRVNKDLKPDIMDVG